MTAEETRKKTKAEEEHAKAVLKLAESWKKMYFESEEALARAVDEYVAGDSFTEILEQMGSQYLAMYKATNNNMDRFFDNHPLPTKKDLARVCELVITVEEKVDHLEDDIAVNMAGLASSLIRLVDYQMVLKEEIVAVRQEVQSLHKLIMAMQAGQNVSSGATAELKENANQDLELVQDKDTSPKKGPTQATPPKPPVRPRTRGKQAPEKK